MICHCKILVAALVVAQAQATVIATDSAADLIVERDWNRISDLYYNQNTVCGQCEGACVKGPTLTPEEAKKVTPAVLHWACYIGCRTTCLLQMGTERNDYDNSKELCTQGCHAEFKTLNKIEVKLQFQACVQGCSAKVLPFDLNVAEGPYAQIDITEETETIMFDPSLKTQNGNLPHSSYKTLPHKDSPGMYSVLKKQLGKQTPMEHMWDVIKDPNIDPIFAGTVVLPLVLAVFALCCYVLYILSVTKLKWTKQPKQHNNETEGQEGDFVTVLRIRVESEEKEALLSQSDVDIDEDFVPPHSPPPKYSDIV